MSYPLSETVEGSQHTSKPCTLTVPPRWATAALAEAADAPLRAAFRRGFARTRGCWRSFNKGGQDVTGLVSRRDRRCRTIQASRDFGAQEGHELLSTRRTIASDQRLLTEASHRVLRDAN